MSYARPPHTEQREARSTVPLIAVMLSAVILMLVGVVKPEWAPRLALVCLFVVAALVTGRWFGTIWKESDSDHRSIPIRTASADSAQNATTAAIGQPTTPLAVTELCSPAGAAGLSDVGQQYLRFIGSEQLWARYRLNLVYQPHWPEIQQRVSWELWSAMNYTLPIQFPPDHFNQLNRLITEIENL